MADEPQVQTEDEAWGALMASYPPESEAPEEEPADDGLAARVAQLETQQRAKQLIDDFRSVASEDVQAIFDSVSEGVTDPNALRGLMKFAKSKADALPKTEVPEEIVEAKAEEKARVAYGVAPVAPGAAPQAETPQQYFDRRLEEGRQGNSKAFFELWYNFPSNGDVTPDLSQVS